jgi:hypothetical protein
METNRLKAGQWVFVEDEKHQYVGVIVNDGSEENPSLYFSGTSETGATKAISLLHIDKYTFKQINL